MGLPKEQLAPGEHVEMTLRTHPKVLILPVIFALLTIAAASALAWYASTTDPSGTGLIIIGIVTVIALIWVLFIPWLRWQSETYTFTNRRLITRTGIVNRSGRDIPLYRINDIEMAKDLVDRMFGCGTLIISDATDKPGVELKDVPHVEAVQVKIQELLHQADDGTDDGGVPPTEPARLKQMRNDDV